MASSPLWGLVYGVRLRSLTNSRPGRADGFSTAACRGQFFQDAIAVFDHFSMNVPGDRDRRSSYPTRSASIRSLEHACLGVRPAVAGSCRSSLYSINAPAEPPRTRQSRASSSSVKNTLGSPMLEHAALLFARCPSRAQGAAGFPSCDRGRRTSPPSRRCFVSGAYVPRLW